MPAGTGEIFARYRWNKTLEPADERALADQSPHLLHFFSPSAAREFAKAAETQRRQSEAALHAATAHVGFSVASLFPDIFLTGTCGLRNLSRGYLFDWNSRFYTEGSAISVPLFHGGALLANMRLARAPAAEAALDHRAEALGARHEVEDNHGWLVFICSSCESLIEPTVFADVSEDSRLAQEEIFGPVLSVLRFRDVEEAIRLATMTAYGLCAYLWTARMNNGFRLANGINSGYTLINAIRTMFELLG